jgi:hypothetical protein
MVAQPKSNVEKHQRHVENKKEALQYAMKLHFEDMKKPEKERRGLRMLAHDAEGEMKKQGKDVRVNHGTLSNHIAGGRSCQEANEENHGWLTPEEDENIVAYCIELAARGTQATVVLQGMFVNRLSGQLQAQEDKQKR